MLGMKEKLFSNYGIFFNLFQKIYAYICFKASSKLFQVFVSEPNFMPIYPMETSVCSNTVWHCHTWGMQLALQWNETLEWEQQGELLYPSSNIHYSLLSLTLTLIITPRLYLLWHAHFYHKAGYTPTRFWESEAVRGHSRRPTQVGVSRTVVSLRHRFTPPAAEKVGPSNHSDWLFTLPLPAGKDSYCHSSTEVFAVCS